MLIIFLLIAAAVIVIAPLSISSDQQALPQKLVMKDGGVMLLIPAGQYKIGSDDGPADTRPAHYVKLPNFFIDQFEVTNAQYHEFCLQTGHAFPPYFRRNQIPNGKENFPVVNINYQDAEDYSRWANKELPTEAEWETAARGPGAAIYPWGDEFKPAAAIRRRMPVAVGSFKNDVSFYGAFDMAGNVMEWTRDEYQSYPGGPKRFDLQGSKIVVKGAWFQSRGAMDSRAFLRHPILKTTKSPHIGFRCVKEMGS